MKKRLLFVAAIFAATATFAQDGLTSKKGEAYLPEAGDWAIGIDANPFLNYAGNLFNGNTGNSIGAGATYFAPGMAIYGKMFKDEKTAYRAMLRIGFGSNTVGTVVNLYADSTARYNGTTTEYTNETSTSARNITLGFGLEKRRGNTRIQGVYGAQLMIGFGGGSSETTYGLAYSAATTISETSGNVVNYIDENNPGLGVYGSPRTTATTAPSSFTLGLNGFIGVEWFFAPKVSLGAEYTWGLAMTSSGASETTTEEWKYATPTSTTRSLVTKTSKGGEASSFSLDNGISGANISLNFHF
jgi:hypothetical protein